MNKNRILTVVSFSEKGEIIDYSRDYNDRDYLPIVSRNDDDWMYSWWNERAVPLSRNNLNRLLASRGMSVPEEYLIKNLGLSLNDCYWIRPVDSDMTWESVNLYTNRFKDNTLEWDQPSGDNPR